MKTIAFEIEDKVDELLNCLDKDIENLQKNLSNLDELRSLVIKHDDVALGQLLEKIRKESDSYKEHELHRQSIIAELARCFNCNINDVTLSKLEAFVPEIKKNQIIQSKTKLKTLTGKLKKENSKTALLLSECARFNKLLLKSVFNIGNNEAIFYNANGATKERNERAFVNLQI
jgi:hypothetical protein